MQRLAQAGEAGEAAGTAGTGEGGVPVVVVQVGEITDLCTPSRGSSEVIPAHLSVVGAVSPCWGWGDTVRCGHLKKRHVRESRFPRWMSGTSCFHLYRASPVM